MNSEIRQKEKREKNIYNLIRVAVFVILYIYIDLTWNHKKFYDADYYWTIVFSFHFSALPRLFRGYFYPYILYVMKNVGLPEDFLYMLFNSVMGMLMITYVVPNIVSGGLIEKISFKRKIFGTCGLFFLLLFYWGDYIKYPLSDFPAMFFLGCAICLLIKVEKIINIEIKKSLPVVHVFILSMLAGSFMYIAYNTRATYLYSIITMLIIWFTLFIKRRKYNTILLLIPMLVGTLLVAYPQIRVNYRDLGHFSIAVPTENFDGGKLQNWQIAQGLTYERYETVLEYGPEQPRGGVKFQDETGMEIAARNKIGDTLTPQKWGEMFFCYPLDFIGMYARATINYMTPLWNEVYIHNMFSDKAITFIINFVLWIVTFGSLLLKKRDGVRRWMENEAWMTLPYIIICLLMIIGAPEVRFFIAGYFLMYGYVCFRLNYGEVCSALKSHPVKIAICIGIILVMWIAIIGATLSHGSLGTVLFSKQR